MAKKPGARAHNEVALYVSADRDVRLDIPVAEETIWLTQRQIAALFDTSSDNIGLHLKKVFAEGELSEAATAEDFSVVQNEGRRQVQRQLKHYNLDAILSFGYRVNSMRVTQFQSPKVGRTRDYVTGRFGWSRRFFNACRTTSACCA
jgi:hypothetical protein